MSSPDLPSTQPSMLALLDLLGRRWALRILWELRVKPANFQALQIRCDSMSTSVLTQRLAELGDAKLVEKNPAGNYQVERARSAAAGPTRRNGSVDPGMGPGDRLQGTRSPSG